MKQKLVVIGNGMAGMRTVEELLKIAPDLYDITVFGAEPHGNYNRILLSPVLAGEKTIEDIMINDMDWYAENNITLHAGKEKEVIDINRARHEVIARDGTTVEYDRLLLATGSDPLIIPFPGIELDGVITFRDISDVDAMLEASRTKTTALVVGGGLLGLEAANGLLKRGMTVKVIQNVPILMNRQLDEPAAELLRKNLEDRGIEFFMPVNTEQILDDGNGHVGGVRFDDGTVVDGDFLVMAVGIKPNIRLAQKVGLQCERGILVNDTMQTFDPRIYSIGECVQHRGNIFGLVAPIWEQAKVCATHLAEFGIGQYEGSVTSTKLKVSGVDLFSAGDFIGDENSEALVFQDPARGVYKRILLKDNRIEGAVMYGDTIDSSWYFQLMRDGTDVASFRDTLLFGQAHLGDAGHGQTSSVADLPDTAEICGCNGVTKGTIVNAIVENELFTLDDVRGVTKASASCGSCTALVEQLLASTMGGEYNPASGEKPVCECMDHTHEIVRKTIRELKLKSFDAVSGELGFRNREGCHVCRPAINYYLLCEWPGEYQDDAQSRFVNERMHANIQKDNTYSVIPRIWGGVTNPAELKAIAEAAEKYEVPTVKITGGQRIDLLGVEKENLPKIWKDLSDAGFVSGHAYGKALRTVKTCVGSEWCRFGTQDSTTMGIDLEKMTWGSWTPAKVKLAVSGCPRNCAEATVKDLGVVAVDSGWELYVAGNGGMKVRVSEFLTKVDTSEEVLEYTGAFMQLYRENGRHNERTAPWVERVGLGYVKDQIVEDAENRKALHARFLESQSHAQVDPWAQRANQEVKTDEFVSLKEVS